MTQSTWAGLRWWGDRLSESGPKPDETGFSSSMINNRWEKRLGYLDKTVLNYLLADSLDYYGYSAGTCSNGIFCSVVVFFLILIPTGHERRYLRPLYLV